MADEHTKTHAPVAGLTVTDKLRLLLDITKKISRSLNLEEVLAQVMDTLDSLLPYDAAGIYIIRRDPHLSEGGTTTLVFHAEAMRGYDIEEMLELRLKLGEGLIGYVAQTGESVVVPDVQKDARYVNARRETRSELVAPIISNDEVIGVFNGVDDRGYGEDDKQLLMLLASQVAIIVEKAMLHAQLVEKKRLEAQLEVARQVQLALLPERDPEMDGFDISAYNFSTEEVSGDYYDFVKPYEDHLGLVIADVSGKGVPASLLMAFLRASLRSAIHVGYAPNGAGEVTTAVGVPRAAQFVTASTGCRRDEPHAGLRQRRPHPCSSSNPAARASSSAAASPSDSSRTRAITSTTCPSTPARYSSSTPTARPRRSAPTGRSTAASASWTPSAGAATSAPAR